MDNKQDHFLSLYKSNHEDFARYCQFLTKNLAEAEDLINDSLLTCYQQFDHIQNEGAFLKYLIGIARRKFFNQQRRLKFRGIFNTQLAESIEDCEILPDTSFEIQILHRALDKLPVSQRESIILFELQGFNLKEVTAIQETNLSTVKSRIRRGKEKLRKLLSDPQSESTRLEPLKMKAL